jgi:aryl-alcohol dehydrogenase-like predicted oxidoreductase
MALTRRELIELGAGAGLALAAGWRPAQAQQAEAGALITRKIPSSGEALPVVGIGTNRYSGGTPEQLAQLRDTVKRFVELGGKVIDTAPSYTRGASEQVLGDIIAELGVRDKLFMATKVDVEGRDAGIERMNASMTKLKMPRVDLMQVHNMRDTLTQLATMREWKQAGKLRYVGITTSQDGDYPEMERVLATELLDFIQVDYSINNRGSAERILPLALDKGVAVLVNVPFGRASVFRMVGDRPLPDWAAEFDAKTWAHFFLKYIIGHPAITCAIPGTTQPQHAEDNNGAARGRLPDAATRTRMEEFFDALPPAPPPARPGQ